MSALSEVVVRNEDDFYLGCGNSIYMSYLSYDVARYTVPLAYCKAVTASCSTLIVRGYKRGGCLVLVLGPTIVSKVFSCS